ncbi:hypothetical protein LXT21_15640 [Myxococcus sp. K38C18041901]|uniref:hypothetical protein n=1 Tax=Myxococcus guangdongensis TaxID=2906760 RepID=UPI0020A7CF7C|nr:hypothetical protein [Myxococcus guangdongensis]MCP3060216.1 hypothetical protein [Myxococcus guangdongensis]
MGILVDVKCSSFILPESVLDPALAALKALAEDRPGEFHEPDGVLEATDLLGAVNADGWEVERDANGLTRLWYGGDKAPHDSDEEWPRSIFETLAPFATAGAVEVFFDGERAWALRLADGELTVESD